MRNVSRRNTGFLEVCSLLVSLNRECLDLPPVHSVKNAGQTKGWAGAANGTQLGLQLEGENRNGTRVSSTYHFLISKSTLPRSWTPLTSVPVFLVPPSHPHSPVTDVAGSIQIIWGGFPTGYWWFWLSPRHSEPESGEEKKKFGQMQRTGGQRTHWPEHWLSHTLGIRLWCFPTMDPSSSDFGTRQIHTKLGGSQWVTSKSAYTHLEHSLPFIRSDPRRLEGTDRGTGMRIYPQESDEPKRLTWGIWHRGNT